MHAAWEIKAEEQAGGIGILGMTCTTGSITRRVLVLFVTEAECRIADHFIPSTRHVTRRFPGRGEPTGDSLIGLP